MLALEGQSLKYSVNMLATCIFYYYVGPGCLIKAIASYAVSYHGWYIYLCPASPEIAATFLVESYISVLERRYYVSCIDFILHFVLPVLLAFWH